MEAKLLTRAKLAVRFNRDARTIDRWWRDPEKKFPRPKKIGGWSLMWDEAEVDAWQQSLPVKQRWEKSLRKPKPPSVSLDDLDFDVPAEAAE